MNRQQLRERVLKLETITPELRNRFEEEIRIVLDKRLKPWERVGAILLVPFGLGFTVFCGALCLSAGPQFSRLIRAEIVLASLLGALLLAWSVVVLKRGRHLRDDLLMPAVAFAFFVIMVAVSIITEGTVEAELLAATVLVGFVVIWERVKVTELRIREGMLRLELQMAELAEDLGCAEKES